jgi:Arc/MetJ-type ribon-helix-helix transcriptional regulator
LVRAVPDGEPSIGTTATEKAGQLKLVKVDIDQAPMLAKRFVIQAVPTLIVLHRGEVIARQAGAAPLDVLRRWLDDAIARCPQIRTDRVKKITITLPMEDAEAVERLAESGQVESVSRYVTEAIAFHRGRRTCSSVWRQPQRLLPHRDSSSGLMPLKTRVARSISRARTASSTRAYKARARSRYRSY